MTSLPTLRATARWIPGPAARRALVALAAIAAVSPLGAATERPLSLSEAVALALEHNETLRIERQALVSASAAVTGARGAYDPLLEVSGGWQESQLPSNTAFSGAPDGELAPTDETAGAGASLRQLLPTGGSLSVRAATDRQTSNGVFQPLSPAYDSSLGVELRQPLLRDRSIDPARLGLRVAATDLERAEAGLRAELTDTVAEVESAYWALIAARREIGVREEAVRLAEEQRVETDARISVGSAPETEAAQPRAEIERRRGELLAAREALARAENVLKLLVLGDSDGAAWADTLVPTESAEPAIAEADVASALERALASRPELAAAQASIDRRRAEAELARDAVRPSLDFVAAYERFGLAGEVRPVATPGGGAGGSASALDGGWGDAVDSLHEDDFRDARVGLVFSLPLGNREARAGAAIAESAEEQARADLARRRAQVRAEVLDAAAALDTARARIEAARAARAAAEVQLAAERERFQAGMSINFLVLTRQNDLSGARLEEIAAQTDYRRATTEMARATGSLLEERGIEVDESDAAQAAAL